MGRFSYDLSYWRYYDINPSAQTGDAILTLAFAPIETFSIGTTLKYNTTTKVRNASLNANWGINDALSLDLTAGQVNKGGPRYWVAASTYTFNDAFSATLAYHKNNTVKGRAVLSLDYSFSLR